MRPDIDGAHDETVQGNYIGINATATATFPNQAGVWITSASNNTIGGAGAGQGNVIGGASGTNAGNPGAGTINNTIANDSTGTSSKAIGLGSAPRVRRFRMASASILKAPATTPSEVLPPAAGNIIADNVGDGVEIGATNTPDGNNLTTASGDTVVGNSIYNNPHGLGIDLLAGPDRESGWRHAPNARHSQFRQQQSPEFSNITSANIVNGQLPDQAATS